MKVVGLTGGIGSGKTFVSELFSKLGVPVYISDKKAKKLMHTDKKLIHSITKLFGKKAYVNNNLNREYIASKVFTDKKLLEKLNAIVHPAVANDFNKWKAKQNSKFVIKEAAILFETGSYKTCDKIILVTAPEAIRIERVRKRDNVTERTVKDRMNNQWPDNQKKMLSDYVINNINRKETEDIVLKINESLKI